jgi:hypothetical protein
VVRGGVGELIYQYSTHVQRTVWADELRMSFKLIHAGGSVQEK